MMKTFIAAFLSVFLGALFVSPDSWAQTVKTTNDLSTLSPGLENLLARYVSDNNDLEARVAELEKSSKDSAWTKKISLKGDFRYRHETIDREGSSHRTRHRLRARVFLGAEVNDMVDFGFQLATGVGDPVSTNQTMGNGFGEKELWLDLAYFDFHPVENDWNLNVIGGKMKTPFVVMSKSELLWDPDLRPEGIAVNFSRDADAGLNFFLNGGGFFIEERSSGADTGFFGGQFGFIIPVTEKQSITTGAGYYDYGNVKKEGPFYDGDFFGNTTDATGTVFAEDFDEVEAFAEYAFDCCDLPVHIFGNYATNLAAQENERAWLAGVKVGNAKKPLTWDFRYQYKVLQADAVFGTFTDSDFGGGGTDARGHEFNAGFAIAKNWNLSVTYFINETGFSNPMASTRDYDRLQIDLKFKF